MYRIFIYFFRLLWPLLPHNLRVIISHYIDAVHRRAAIEVPLSEVCVYVTNEAIGKGYKQTFSSDTVCELSAARPSKFSYTLITTCRNEAQSVFQWLDSVSKQTLPPAEVVIVDGGSTDGTVQKIRAWIETNGATGMPIVLEEGTRLNIAQGRNRAVALAKHETLFFTDMGCVLDPRWAQLLAQVYCEQPESEVVMGWYHVMAETEFQKQFVELTVPQLEGISPKTFLPSARSMALTKKAFLTVGGFPEFLTRAGEDSLFDWRLKKSLTKFAFVPEAIVYWQAPRTWWKSFRTIFSYARGDAEGETLFWSHYISLLSAWSRIVGELIILAIVARVTFVFPTPLLIALVGICMTTTAIAVGSMLMPYQLTKSPVLARLSAALVVTIGQALGFLTGLFALRLKANHL